MKRALDNLRLDYEYNRDFLYSALGAFFAVVIAISTTSNTGMRVALYITMVAIGIIVIYTSRLLAKRYRILRNSKL